MIIDFTVENFLSIKQAQSIYFNVTKKDFLNDSARELLNNLKCNTITSLIGNNASGKTNMLRALAFLLWSAKYSYENKNGITVDIAPHKLSSSLISSFTMHFEKQGKEYEYILKLSPKQLEYEFLGVKKTRGYSYLYEVQRRNGKLNIEKWSSALGKLNQYDKVRFLNMHPCSLFSFLLSTGHLNLLGFKNLHPFQSNVGAIGKGIEHPFEIVAKEYTNLKKDERKKQWIEQFLQECDLAFSGFEFEEKTIPDPGNESKERKVVSLKVKHKIQNKEFSLSLLQESNGTQHLVSLLDRVFSVLDMGGILIWDEIEDSLHPYLARKVLQLFTSKKLNPSNAQLIFTTHAPLLLDNCTKTQIYLVEKNVQLASDVFCLADVEGVRNTDNFAAKYLTGTYGAVPTGRWF